MKNKSSQITVVAGLSVFSLIIWNFTDFFTTSRMIASQVFVVGGYILFRFVQGNKINEYREKMRQQDKKASLSKNEVRRIADKWADNEVKGNVQIDWNMADKVAKPIYEDGQRKDEYICVPGARTDTGRSIQIYILASERDVKENRVIRSKDYYKYPFKYSPYWQEIKRQSRNRLVQQSEGQDITITPGGMSTNQGSERPEDE